MTKGELIERLMEYPDDTILMVDGYGGGMTDSITIIPVDVILNKHHEWYYGKHDIAIEGEAFDIKAVLLSR